MPARAKTTKTTETTNTGETMPETTETTETTETMPATETTGQEETPKEETPKEETPKEETPKDVDNTITVNVAIAVRIDPARWSLADQSEADLLTIKIMAEKGISEEAARPLADLMIENGLGGLVTKTSGNGGANDVRREIREYVLAQCAALKAFADAGATVELNEARRTNHAVK